MDTSYATPAALAPSSVLARNENIVYTNLDDTIVMMDVDEGRYFELTPVAAQIWMLLEEQQTTQSICDALVEEYDVSAETCQQDTLEFLQTSVGQHIVRAEDVPPPQEKRRWQKEGRKAKKAWIKPTIRRVDDDVTATGSGPTTWDRENPSYRPGS